MVEETDKFKLLIITTQMKIKEVKLYIFVIQHCNCFYYFFKSIFHNFHSLVYGLERLSNNSKSDEKERGIVL